MGEAMRSRKDGLRRLMAMGLAGGLVLMSGCGGMKRGGDALGGVATAERMLGDPGYRAMSYSGWRTTERRAELCPTVGEIKEDLRLMEAMGVRMIRTYNTQIFPQAERILEAIAELEAEDAGFEMYVMLGAWIQCQGAYEEAGPPVHTVEDEATNRAEIERAIELAEAYPGIVKMIAVGNEAMVTWQPHHVAPSVIHRWVKVLQEARAAGRLKPDLWITTSDNWAALGGEASYRNDDLLALLRALDFVSLHTYAFHDTYYYPTFRWAVEGEAGLPVAEQRAQAVERALGHQQAQVEAMRAYMTAHGIERAIHIGETGWASRDDSHYGPEGTRAADEYTQKLFHDAVRAWTDAEGMSCFFFEGFDEPWKSSTVDGSENHFGLFTVDGKAKAVIWDLVEAGVFEGLGRDGKPVTKTFGGDDARLMETVEAPAPIKFQPPVPGAAETD